MEIANQIDPQHAGNFSFGGHEAATTEWRQALGLERRTIHQQEWRIPDELCRVLQRRRYAGFRGPRSVQRGADEASTALGSRDLIPGYGAIP